MKISLGILLGSTYLSRRVYSPSELFAASEPGAWYDPSDLTTMFQDSAGTTPVTATGQTVGMVLDKSKGLARGSELWVTPTLAGTSWVWDGSTLTGLGVATGTATSNASVAGRFYRVTFTVGPTGSGLFQVRVGDTFLATLAGGANTTYTYIAQAANTSGLRFTSSGGTTGTVSNISVKELAGNHLTQATAADRPAYGIEPFGGRRNLATFTEQFENAVWLKLAATVSTNAAVAPDGTTTADRIVEDNTTSAHGFQNLSIYNGVATGADTCNSIYCKADTRSRVAVGYTSSGGVVALNYVTVDLSNGSILSSAGVGGTVENVGNGWYRIKLNTVPMGASVGRLALNVLRNTDAAPTSYLGDGTSGVLVWGAQGEVASTATAYQRVTDQYNVTQAGVPSVSYLQFNDDSFISPTITPGIDKAQVFAGVRKLSDAAEGMLLETSTTLGAGSLRMYAPRSASNNYSWRAGGSSQSEALTSGYTAPITNVLTGIGDIAADTAILRVNGVQSATSATDQGTGNFLAYPLYIGRRGGTLQPFNGRLYQLIVRFGANLSAERITRTEQFIAEKTGVYTLQQLAQIATLDASGTSYNSYAASDATNNNYLVPKTVLNADGTSYLV